MALSVVGVRHHSPACARLVASAIRALRPRHVLVEGPADMNARLDELRLPHELPVAIFTYYQTDERTHASWTPFCRHSPEWVALEVAREVGAEVRFIDLPAWDDAFAGVRNRYRDRTDRAPGYAERLCEKLRVDNVDALWDHLFEQPLSQAELAERLDAYFDALRGEQPSDERDGPREAYMTRCIAWALGDAALHGGDVLVVCGGYHAPALRRAVERAPREARFPEAPVPQVGARQGSYLVPYSWKRLDSFVGYQSGMPSPAFYDAVWALGPAGAPEALLRRAVVKLRARKQPVSPADLIACSTLTAALQRVRGHAVPSRIDVLDGMAGALVKDALEAPLPWSYRGALLPRTDPLLVEVLQTFSGDHAGTLAPGTPRPPLLFDVTEELSTLDLEPGTGRAVALQLADERDRRRSRVLHRLRVLRIPGFVRSAGPSWATDAALSETWQLSSPFEQESALIEAAAWGATLQAAAAARLEEELLAAGGRLAPLAALLGEATFIGVTGLALRVLSQVAAAVHTEPSLGELGEAAARVLSLWRHDALLGARDAEQLALVLEAAFDRGLWLFEGVTGDRAPADEKQLLAAAALRDILRFGEPKLSLPRERAVALMTRRARDDSAPPAIRGAAVGFLWNLDATDGALATATLKAVARPQTLGDFLAGLFVLAREEASGDQALVAALDTAVRELGGDEFLIGLPSLRLAFSYFPPLEREELARSVLRTHGADPASARDLLSLPVAAEQLTRAIAFDAALDKLLARFGLDGEVSHG